MTYLYLLKWTSPRKNYRQKKKGKAALDGITPIQWSNQEKNNLVDEIPF